MKNSSDELYDTSALISACKKRSEGLRGYTTILNVVEYPPSLALRGLRVIYPTREDYELAIRLQIRLRRIGRAVGAIDLLVASVAVRRSLEVVTSDRDFKAIAEVEPRLRLRPIEDKRS
ncbi:MAG: PIN domain-containing protein [Candidatus Korarchaeota archaeon]|nr:PIN domain-containing protein [Candidatus Korarchaeota archaeon]